VPRGRHRHCPKLAGVHFKHEDDTFSCILVEQLNKHTCKVKGMSFLEFAIVGNYATTLKNF
jgi:hypothetical protein